jgi:epoxyqueuosine reductase
MKSSFSGIGLRKLPPFDPVDDMEWTADLKATARTAGADLVGIADLTAFGTAETLLPPHALEPFTRAVAVAVHLDDAVVEGIERAPTLLYAQHYRAVNASLDRLTADLVKWIKAQGYSARAIPASQIVDEHNLLGSISHKAIARLAGIGWQGKSLLIVSPQYGSRIRLATVLTDLPLIADKPVKNRCGTCHECAKACPASAIKNIRTADRYATREEALHFDRCVEQTRRFKARLGIEAQICGVCVQVCPFGKRI